MRRTGNEDGEGKTVAFTVSFAGRSGEVPAPSTCVFTGREELVAREPAEDNRLGTRPAPQQEQHSRAIYELLPQWMR